MQASAWQRLKQGTGQARPDATTLEILAEHGPLRC
jgi:hypothetical protein